MPRTHDPHRENRITDEIIVDCYDDEEERMGWYYYMSDNLTFPITATISLLLQAGASEIKAVEIVEIDPKSEQGYPIRLGILEKGSERIQYINPEAIISLNTSPENLDIKNDWLYWHNFELLLI